MRALLPAQPQTVQEIAQLVADAGVFPDLYVLRDLLEHMCARQEAQRYETTEGRRLVVRYTASPLLLAAQQKIFDAPQERP